MTLFALLILLKKSEVAPVVIGLTFSLSPIALFFIVSTNPISWAITSISFSFIFLLLTVNSYKAKKKLEIFPILLTLLTFILGVGARFDSLFYLAVSYTGAFIVSYKKEIDLMAQKLKHINKIILRSVECILIFMITKFTLITLHGNSINLNSEIDYKNSPNPILNILIEIPAFLVGLVGGQEPRFQQARGELGRDFTYGAGWLEYNFLSITGIFLSFAIATLVFNQLRFVSESKIAVFILYSTSFISLIVIERAHWKYLDGAYFQPRYFSGLLCAFLISILLVGEIKDTKMSKAQHSLLYSIWIFGQYLAWKTSYTRYTSGLEYSITNLQNQIEWRPYYLIPGFIYVSILCHVLLALISFKITSKQVFTREIDQIDFKKLRS